MTISIVKCLLKNIYICTVYTIFADYIFACKWLSVSITGFKRNYFVCLRFFFLVHLIKKKELYMTLLETSCHNLLLIHRFSIHSICYLFLHSREHIHMECSLVYLDTETESLYMSSRGGYKSICMSRVVIYPFQSHTMDYRMLPHYYCGIIKCYWRTTFLHLLLSQHYT